MNWWGLGSVPVPVGGAGGLITALCAGVLILVTAYVRFGRHRATGLADVIERMDADIKALVKSDAEKQREIDAGRRREQTLWDASELRRQALVRHRIPDPVRDEDR